MPSKLGNASASKQQRWSLIFTNLCFNKSENQIYHELRQNYNGVHSVTLLLLPINDETMIDAVRIDFSSKKSINRILSSNCITLKDQEYSFQSSKRSVIVPNGPTHLVDTQIFGTLKHNYLGIEKICRFMYLDEHLTNHIQIDISLGSTIKTILDKQYILIDGKQYPIQPCWTFADVSSTKQENKPVSIPEKQQLPKPMNIPEKQQLPKPMNIPEKQQLSEPMNFVEKWSLPKPEKLTSQTQQISTNMGNSKPFTEKQVKELFDQHKRELESMINQFESKWNEALSLHSLNKNKNDQVLSMCQELQNLSQQLEKQNAHIQSQLASVYKQISDINIKPGYSTYWPTPSNQNGH